MNKIRIENGYICTVFNPDCIRTYEYTNNRYIYRRVDFIKHGILIKIKKDE